MVRGEGLTGYSHSIAALKAITIRAVNFAPQPRGGASAAGVCLLKTRVWGSSAETVGYIGGSGWVSSTLRWGSTPVYDGTAVGSLDQRYYATGAGRFITGDPYKASAGAGDPGSWNRYAYVQGDPINFSDPSGLEMCPESYLTVEVENGVRWFTTHTFICITLWGHNQRMFDMLMPIAVPMADLLDEQLFGIGQGLQNARGGLKTIATGAFKASADCQNFFIEFARATGTMVSPSYLMDQAATVAGQIADQNMLFDGPSATLTPLSDVTGNPASQGTVAQAMGGMNALSQSNGLAIWINAGSWAGITSTLGGGGGATQYGLGMLLHEVLHKQMVGGGFRHNDVPDPLAAALTRMGISATGGREALSDKLGKLCF